MNVQLARWFIALTTSLLLSVSARAANPPPTQVFYVPFPEDNQLTGFLAVTTGNGNTQAADPLAVFVTFSAATDNTVIYYDHWEDGYEKDLTNPVQSTTLVFGDGNPANGYPPGNAGDLIPAGTVFSLRNYVATNTLQSVLDYDARDKVASFKPISLTKTSFPAATNTVLAGCIEVFEQGLWGTEYRVPVGVNMPTSTATATLTTDADIFNYTSLSIMAGAKGATVQIDADNNGSFEQTVNLTEGQTSYVTGVNVGGKVVSNNPVQVILFSGRIGSDWMSRDTSLLPTYRWNSSYYAPVSTSATYGTAVFLYNPGASAITVNYAYRSSTSAYTTASVSVPAGGNARVNLSPSNGTNHFGAYHFYTTGATPPVFYAFCAVDATNATAVNNNRVYDGGFTLVGQPSLTTQVLVSLGIGRDPYSATNPAENGNPVWLTTVGNGHTPETIYVDFDGDNAGPLTDPNGNRYDVAYSLRELQQQQIFDPDGDQSGMLAYSLNPLVKIASAWAQDPTVATAAQPGLDVSTLLPPLREGEAGKKSDLSVDADGDGYVSAGDTLEYDIRAINSARAGIPGPFAVQDNLPPDVTYVSGTTRYRYSVGGNWQAWVGIPDDGSGTPFPLDGSGFSVPGNLGTGQQLQVVFKATIKNYAALTGPTITNSGFVEISPYGLVLPIEWKDIIYGSIGDRVWNDLDGDGVQDGGEAGIAGIDVFADTNNNGVWDAGEPKDTTDSNGDYLIAGLPAGTYTVRVDPADISAVNVGYGPSYDLDGVATSYVATVILAGAQDRVDADFGFRVGASVGDRVWMDRDADDVQEAGEPGINGVRVYIDLDNDNTYDVGEPNTITSGDGTYYIGNLNPGTYAVRVDTSTLPGGASQTYDLNGVQNDHEASVTLLAAEHRGTVDFGYNGTLSISDLVWNDVDGNGTNTSESGIANVRVYIDANGNGIRDASEAFATTNASGVYSISNLFNGNYTVRVDTTTLPASFVQTYDLSSPTNDHTALVTLSGSSRTDVDFGYRNDATIGNLVWNDRNANGVRDAGEPGIEGVMVYIDADGDNLFDQGVERFAITDVAGYYQIDNLAAGTYAVRVEISTLPQGSTQTYDLNGAQNDHEASRVLAVSENAGDVDFGYRASAGFGDLIWNDSDADGIKDAGESGIVNVRVFADLNGNGIFDSATEPADLTDASGIYLIDNLVPGTYTARVDTSTLPAGMSQTYDPVGALDNAATFFISATQTRTDIDFGYTAPVTIGDLVWADNNANGQKDVGETGLAGVTVTVYNAANDTVADTSTTGASGLYSFSNLLPGTYYIVFDSLAGYNRTPENQGADVSDSDANIVTGRTQNINLTGGQSNLTLDAGYYQPSVISGFVLTDTNNDNVGDSGISGVTVTLFTDPNNDGNPADGVAYGAVVTTASDGSYSFTNLPPGSYVVVETQPAGYLNVRDGDTSVDTVGSPADAANVTTDNRIAVNVMAGETDAGNNFVEEQPGTISGHLYIDTNGDGNQDPGEPNLASVNVIVTDVNGTPQTVATDANGSWTATVPPGSTTANVDETDPEYPTGYTQTDGTDPTTVTVVPGTNTDAGIDGYYQPGTVSGHLYIDTNGDGNQDPGEPNLANVNVIVTDANGTPQTVATDATGNWTATVPPGSTSAKVDETDPEYPTGHTQTEGTDPTVVTAVAGANTDAGIDGFYQPGTISGHLYIDTNGDGNQDSGEPNLANVNVIVTDANGTPQTVATDATGNWTATVPPGSITANVDETDPDYPTGHTQTEGTDPTVVTAIAGTNTNAGIDGYYQPGTVSGHLYLDTDGDGNQDSGEPYLANVNVIVTDVNGTPQTVATDANGNWTATVPPGSTSANVDEADPDYPTGYTQTEGTDPTVVTAVAGTNTDAGIDGYYIPGIISGHLYIDTNGDGNQDPGEPDLANVNVIVTDANGTPQTVATDATGNWTATVPPGSATANVDETDPDYPTGYTQTEGTDPTTVTAVAGTNTNAGIDGYYIPGSISGTVLVDTDDDGDGDIPLEGVVIRLLDSVGNPVIDDFGDPVTTTTAANGTYGFGNVTPGDYCVVQNQPTNYNSVSDTDGPNDNVIGNVTPITVTGGNNNSGNDFIEIELGVISGYVRLDTDNNGSGDAPLPGVVLNLLDGSGNPVLDGLGAPIQVASGAGGFYSFTLVPTGNYRVSQNQPATYGSVSDVDGANNNLIGDETPIVMTPGLVVTNRDFVEIQFGAISGRVFKDTNDDGTGDTVFPGVVIALLDGAGNPVDGDPVTSGVQPRTITTGIDGSYYFGDLFPGNYQTSETQPSGFGSVSDVDGGNPDLIGNITAITVNPGQQVTGRDFVEIELGAISGYVYVGSTPLAGVTLTLLDEFGDPVDGDPNTPGVQPITTVTSPLGFYQFTGVIPGTYQVAQTQPLGYDSFGDIDGGDLDIIGDVTPITIAPGQHSQNNNFIETLDTCPDDWAEWKFQHPGEDADGNPDADAYDNLAEFAFAMPADNGTGSPWLGNTAWIIRPSTIAPGTLEGVFIRPKGAPLNVTYTLQYAATPGNPTVWQSIVITPSMITTVDNGDCTETVTIHDLETVTGFTGGSGTVRIKADLDEDPPTGTDHTSYSEVEGWKETPLELCCRTYNNPYLRETAFTGTVSGVSGQDLTFAVSGGSEDLSILLGPGASYYLEVTSGENEGHRFDIASASGNTITLANDASLHAAAAPFNTLTGAPPVSLAGDSIVIRRHWTLGEFFPASGFGATGSQSSADQVQVFSGGAWTIYWLYDENDADPATARWVDAAASGMADQGGTVIQPGQGVFFNNRTAVTSILAYGEIRPNDFIRPLAAGSNLVGGGYPIDQSADGTLGRAMNIGTGFFGSRDFKAADSIFVWKADTTIGAPGYETYFLLNGAPTLPSLLRWAKVGDPSLQVRDAEVILLGNRSVFSRAKNEIPEYTIPSPWTP